jgi:hypothetical protein
MQEAAALQGGDINKLKAAHRQEVDGLVKKYNAKYNQLLTDKMAMEDQMTEDHAAAMRELEARLRAEFAAASKYALPPPTHTHTHTPKMQPQRIRYPKTRSPAEAAEAARWGQEWAGDCCS